jgi:hypothetical protein
MFPSQDERPSITPVRNKRQIYRFEIYAILKFLDRKWEDEML